MSFNVETDTIELVAPSSVKRYLEATVSVRRTWPIGRNLTGPYICLEDYVLQHGVGFTEFSSRTYANGLPRQCFTNAYRLAARSNGYLTYVEGYAYWALFPVLHAWNMTPEGHIVDKTWDWLRPDVGFGFFGELKAEHYYGVPFSDLNIVRAARCRGCSVIDDWQRGWPLLQEQP